VILRLWTYAQSRLNSEDGATMVEYGIMITVIAFVAIAGATVLGIGLDAFFKGAEARLP
jgi:pilus assembly protein Flp/PilA